MEANSRFTTFKLEGGTIGSLDGFELKAEADKNIKLRINFSKLAKHKETYPLVASQYQDGQIAGRITFDLTAIKESEDYVYGNPRSKELHTTKCPYWDRISDKNKIPFVNIEDGIARGYDGCAFCLSDFNTG